MEKLSGIYKFSCLEVKDCYNFHVRYIVSKVYIEIIYFRKGSIYVNWSIGSRRH